MKKQSAKRYCRKNQKTLWRYTVSKEKKKRYIVIRAGNIFGSSGSVIERWTQEISQNNEISITEPEMTRYFINVNNLVDFIIEILETGENGNVYIPFQKTAKLSDLAQATIDIRPHPHRSSQRRT